MLLIMEYLRSLKQGMDQSLDPFDRRRTDLPRRKGARPPLIRLVEYRDPEGGYILKHPKEWKSLRKSREVCFVSDRVGCFVMVHTLSSDASPWESIQRSMTEAGGSLELSEKPRTASNATGKISIWNRHFHWTGKCLTGRDCTYLLSAGNVIDKRRSRNLEEYEDRILCAVRRSFRLLPVTEA